jgi:hypothetical protein
MTSLCFDVLGRQELTDEPVDEAAEAVLVADGVEERLCRGLLLRRVAEAFAHLSRAECAAFLFHLQPDVAEQLILSLVPGSEESLALGRVAAGLRMCPSALEEALEEIPWSDLRIAAFLGLHRGSDRAMQMYIINRRQRAIRVMRRIVERDGADGDRTDIAGRAV